VLEFFVTERLFFLFKFYLFFFIFKGNHIGIAYVEFKNGQVAEIAAKSMNNYLLAEKIINCFIVEQNKIPKCIQSGKRFGKIIEPGENRLFLLTYKIKKFFFL
jgi:RNA recognition motif-containing protein